MSPSYGDLRGFEKVIAALEKDYQAQKDYQLQNEVWTILKRHGFVALKQRWDSDT